MDERYQRLVRQRSALGWTLSAVMLGIFFGYILLVSFFPDFLTRPIGSGVTSIGIPIGIGVIVSGIVMTGLYVWIANAKFDPLLAELRKEYGA